MNKIKSFVRKLSDERVFAVFAAVMVLLRLWTLQGMPIWALSFAIHDDRMMVDIAHAVLNGGPAYNNLTLVKGWAFPLFLAVLHKLRIPYIQGMALLNAAVSLMAVQAFREEKRRPFHYVLFVVLLFNPAMTSAQVLMRVYRNGFSAVTAFMVVICAIAVYRRRREVKRSWIPWVLAESIALPAFWYTREDSIWLLPFVAGSALVAVVSILVGGGGQSRFAEQYGCCVQC